MAEIILVCRSCDKQPAACHCVTRNSENWLRQEPVVRIRDLRVSLYIAKGQLEYLTDEELNDHYKDVEHERQRRSDNGYSFLAESRIDGESG